MTTSLPAIALIGTGKMGGAIIEGLLQPGVEVASLRATTHTEVTAELLRTRGVETASIEAETLANEWAVAAAEIVIVAVKPHALLEVCRSIAHALAPDAVVVSVAAGLTTPQIESVVAHPVVRAMPNTPAQIRRGVTGLAAGSRVSSEQMSKVREIFALIGDVVEAPEEMINALSAISGSGPAYLFYVAEKLIDVARQRGFDSDQSRVMVQGTLLGAAALLDSSGDSPEVLRKAVTSPGGTTERAIATFDEAGLGDIFQQAIDAAITRAEELSRGS